MRTTYRIKFYYLFIITLFITIGFIILINIYKYKPSWREGQLLFYTNDQMFKKIFVQTIQTNQWLTEHDLICPASMPDTFGMLFIFEQKAMEPFRIKKKFKSFDIIFVAPNNKIVIIQQNVPTDSMQILSSDNEILYNYVVIVNAGFCNYYSINVDDSVSFKLTNKNSE